MKHILICGLIALLISCKRNNPQQTGLEGKPLPSFNLLLADSATILNTLSSPPKKPLVLLFFRPDCPHSIAQTKDIVEHIRDLKDIQFYLFTDYPFPLMKQFYNEYHLNKYSNIQVGIDNKNFFIDSFNVEGVPFLALYGKDKLLQKVYKGKVGIQQIRDIQ